MPEPVPADAVGALRTFHHSQFPAARLAAERDASVSVCLPARNERGTIGPILRCLTPLLEGGAIDQLVVVDDSTDGTAELAREHGAEVHRQSNLCAECGPVRGKGDAMWRAMAVLTGEVVCFLDADSEHFGEHYACGLVGAVVCEPDIAFAKGYYRRPFRVGATSLPQGGGRVSELMARPLLNFFYPELAHFFQPLAGEIAARRELLMGLPFVTGYGVDIGLLIDAFRREGLGRLAQVDLEVRQNRHQPLSDLVPMSEAVLGVVLSRLVREGRLALTADHGFLVPFLGADVPSAITVDERPPPADVFGRV